MSLRTLIALLLAAAFSLPVVHAADPISVDTPPFVSAADAPKSPGADLQLFVAAHRALELGFPSVAAGLYTRLLEAPQNPAIERNTLVLDLVSARLDEGRTDEAEKALQLYSGAPSAAWQLRVGLIASRRKRLEAAKTAAAATRIEELNTSDRAWWQFLYGQIWDASNEFLKAREAYQRASEIAVSDLQRAHFTLARELARLNQGEATEAQVVTLRQNVERYQGRAVGYAYARQYAALLAARGATAEAIDFLNRQLQALPVAERSARDDFRLLLGIIAGPQRGEGRNALENLVVSGDDKTSQRVALQLLARTVPDAAFFKKLNDLINASIPHPILEDLLLVRAELGLREKSLLVVAPVATADKGSDTPDRVEKLNQAQTENDAKALLAKFPGSQLKPAALGVLADLAWDMKRFRTAADYAMQAKSELPPGEVRAALGVLVAEAWYRAGDATRLSLDKSDFRSADEAYAAALKEVPTGVAPGALIAQQVLSKIMTGQLDDAAKVLDGFAGDSRLDVIHRWQIEWTLARGLQAAERTDDAYGRVNKIMESAEAAGGALPVDLRVRMMWLQVRLTLDAGQPQRALELAKALPAALTGIDPQLRIEVEGATHLLEARANFALKRPVEAIALLESLRDPKGVFAKTDSAAYSYVSEADYYAETNNFVKAQGALIELADKFSKHSYAPYALYRAALNAEQRGQDQYYGEAYRILNRLVTEYPDADEVFAALMKQGDLARRLNDFGRARLTYEHLINKYDPQKYDVLPAELALAACHRALITPNDVSHYESALTILERLQDLPGASLDLRVEAAFQLGDLLATNVKAPNLMRAEAVWWALVTTFLLDDVQAEKLGPKGRYWAARALLRLGDLRRDKGNLEEARNAYRIILEKNLPFAKLARDVYTRAGGKP